MRRELGPPSPDRLIAALAAAQDGVVGHDQLLSLGLSEAAIARRLAAGRLHLIHRGVYAVGHTSLTARGRRIAAVLACGPGAVLSHQTAADQWGIRPSASPRIHVSLTTRSGRRRPGIIIHRPRSLPAHEISTQNGIAITTPARTLLDLADAVSVPDLRKAVERTEKLRLFDGRAITAVLEDHTGRRTKKLRAALDQADYAPKRSDLESDFLALCREHGLPRPEVNVVVGPYEVDFLFREHGLAVETDGWEHHRTKQAFERDRKRDVELAKLGLRTVRLTHDRITHHGADVAGDLSSLLRL